MVVLLLFGGLYCIVWLEGREKHEFGSMARMMTCIQVKLE
jgi:hypothetical protein